MQTRLRLTGLIALLASVQCLSAQISNPVARTLSGRVSGVMEQDIAVFKGIPYAAPPVGELRWKPPAPAVKWRGVRDGSQFGSSCIQDLAHSRLPWTEEFMTQNATAEDCLTLNVWTPARAPFTGKPAAVYVFAYGGGFNEGSSSIAAYDGASLARHGVVVVTINYRVGYLGFMAHPGLTAESATHSSGNYGLLDIVAALQWVKGNIRNFGGDPTQVTLGGQSAGAMAVTALATSPLANGLFIRAVAESGGAVLSPNSLMPSLNAAEANGSAYARLQNADSIAALRALPANEFLGSRVAQLKGPRNGMIVDGWVLPAQPNSSRNRNPRLAWIVGMNADEASLFPPSTAHMSAEEFRGEVSRVLGPNAERFAELYPIDAAHLQDTRKQAARDRATVSLLLWCRSASAHTSAGVFPYYFARATPWPEHPEFGAFHTSEVPYFLGTLPKVHHPYTASDIALSSQMETYLANFVRSGNPNGNGLPEWNGAGADSRKILRLDANQSGSVELVSADRFAFWKAVLETGKS